MNVIKRILIFTLLFSTTGQLICGDTSWWSRFGNWTSSFFGWASQNPGKTATAAVACYLGYRYYCKKASVKPHWTANLDQNRTNIKNHLLAQQSIVEKNGRLTFGSLVQEPIKKQLLLQDIMLWLKVRPSTNMEGKLNAPETLLNELLNPKVPKQPLSIQPEFSKSTSEHNKNREIIIKKLLEDGNISITSDNFYDFSQKNQYPRETLHRINSYIFNNDQRITDLINQSPDKGLESILNLLLLENQTLDKLFEHPEMKDILASLAKNPKAILINTFIEEGYVRVNNQAHRSEFTTFDNDVKLHILNELAKADHFPDESLANLPYYFKKEHTQEDDNNLLNILLGEDDDKKRELLKSLQDARIQWQNEIENQEKAIEKNPEQQRLINQALKEISSLPQLLLTTPQIKHNLVREYTSKINALRNRCESGECSKAFRLLLEDKIKDVKQKLTELLQALQQKYDKGKEEE